MALSFLGLLHIIIVMEVPSTITSSLSHIRSPEVIGHSTARVVLFVFVSLMISMSSFGSPSERDLLDSNQVESLPQASKLATLRIFADDWEDYSGADGTGLYFDIIRAVFKGEPVTLEFVYQPVRRGIELMKRGKGSAVVGLWHQRHSAETDDYVTDGLPLDVEIVSAVFPVHSTWTWQRLRSEQEARYAWVKGYEYGAALDLPRQARVPSSINGLKMLDKNHIDGFIDDQFYVTKVIRKTSQFEPHNYRIEPILTRNMYLAFRPDAQGKQWLAIYRKNMASLLREGKLHTLFAKWGLDYERVKYRELDRY